jgi:hypothetical protein
MDLTLPIPSGPASDSSPVEAGPSLAALEARIESLELDRERFLKALRGAVAMLLENPMASAMMPKDMKRDLRIYLENNGNGTTEKI